MQLPKFLRKLIWISMAVFVVALVTTAVLSGIYQPNDTSNLLKLPLPMLITTILTMISFFLIPGAFIGSIIVRTAENAGLRHFGESATAKVLAIHTTGERDNGSPVMRIKLEVHPPNGAPFEAVAEDVIPFSQFMNISEGATVSVRYDPNTKEVALEKIKRTKAEDF